MTDYLKSNILRELTKAGIILLLMAILSSFLLVCIYSLPLSSKFEENIQSSAEILVGEGRYPSPYSWCFSQCDNFSDALIIQEIGYKGSESNLEKTFMNYYYKINGSTIDYMEASLDNTTNSYEVEKMPYSRYWHGYSLVLKPLFYFFNIYQIRILNLVIVAFLSFLCLYLMYKKSLGLAIAYLSSILIMNPLVIAHSMFFSTIYLMTQIFLIILLCQKKVEIQNKLAFIFLIFGAMTSFFDLLSYPVVGLVFPLVLITVLTKDQNLLKERIVVIIKLSVFWGVGYIGFWCLKWVIGSIVLNRNLFIEAINTVQMRTSHDIEGASFSIFSIAKSLLKNTIKNPLIIISGLGSIWCIINAVRDRFNIREFVPYIILAVIPIAWLLVKANHTFLHSFFTYRELASVLFALLCGLLFSRHKVGDANVDRFG